MNIVRATIILFFGLLVGLHYLSQPMPSSNVTIRPDIEQKHIEKPAPNMAYAGVQYRTVDLSAEAKECLTKNTYWEARGESIKGMRMVARVVLNRVKNNRWEDTVCGVIKEPDQFSWTNNLRWDHPLRDRTSVMKIKMIIDHLDNSGYWVENKPSHHYHHKGINWKYSNEYEKLEDIGNHRFYL